MTYQTDDYYQILEVNDTVSKKDLKAAYQKLVKQYHPDLNPNGAEKLKQINQAYSVLSDSSKRQQYDQARKMGIDPDQYGSASGGGFRGFDFSSMGGFEDILNVFTRDRRRQSRNSEPVDLQYKMSIELEEAYLGCKKTININKYNQCKSCFGNGNTDGKVQICTNCKGQGYTMHGHAFFQLQQACEKCEGNGRIVTNPCKNCKGNGRVLEQTQIDIKIPKGIDDGQNIKIVGYGNVAEKSDSKGDLYILVNVNKHEFFKRTGRDLYIDIVINLDTAILGGVMQIPLLNNKTCNITIPIAVQFGAILRVKGKGMHMGNSTGDLYCKVQIEIPKVKNLTVWREFLDKNLSASDHPQQQNFFNKIKQFFGW